MSSSGIERQSWFSRNLARFVVILSAAILIIVSLLVYFVLTFRTTDKKAGLEFEVPDSIYIGIPFEARIGVSNETGALMNNSLLTLDLPDDLVNLGASEGEYVDTVVEDVGVLGSGSYTKRVISLMFTSDALKRNKEVGEPLIAVLAYENERGTRFENQNEFDFDAIKDAPINLTFEPPVQVVAGSPFEFSVQYENTSEFNLHDLKAQLSYPTDFTFLSASLTPDSLNNYWEIGELRAGSKGSLSIKGIMEKSSVSGAVFSARLSTSIAGRAFDIKNASSSFPLSASPVEFNVSVSGNNDNVVRPGTVVPYLLRYRNTSGSALLDVVVRASLVGEWFDKASTTTDGRLENSSSSIVWDATNVAAFRSLEPGAAGELMVRAAIKGGKLDGNAARNARVRLSAELESPTVPNYLSGSRTHVTGMHESKVVGAVTVDAQAFYRDSDSGIVNAGALPPKVGVGNEYSIHWIIKNYAGNLSNVQVKTKLPSHVSYKNIVKGDVDTKLVYDEVSRELRWELSVLSGSTTGAVAKQVVFQIQATPGLGHIGQYLGLIGETTLTSNDAETGVSVTASDVSLTTQLSDDKTVSSESGRVVP